MHEYIPVTGKGILVDKNRKNSVGSHIGDIILSLFIGLLDII
jgi:hypothetical protein